MEPNISLEVLGKTGSRAGFLARVIGPGATDYRVPLAITDTILAVWGGDPSEIAKELMGRLVYSHGTSRAFANDGYWFDSYNSEITVNDTLNKINNFGDEFFLKQPSPNNNIAAIFGGDILDVLESLSHKFFTLTSRPLIGSLDFSFERSEATSDLDSPPDNKPELLYRVCILSVLIDGFRLRLNDEPQKTGSLLALKKWLAQKFGETKAKELTESFRQVKNLRKQYPIHEHFKRDPEGQRQVRDEVIEAETFFGFRDIDDDPARWKKISDSFKSSLSDLSDILDEDNQEPE